jgi:hypothetical protein
MIRQASKVDQLTTAVSLLESTFDLLKQRSSTEACSSKESYAILHKLYNICIDKDYDANIKQLIRTNRLKNNVLQQVIRALNTLVETDSQIIHVSSPRYC